MSGEPVLTVLVVADDEGELHAQIESELSEREAIAVLGAVLADLDEGRDRADQVEAWGADRRRGT